MLPPVYQIHPGDVCMDTNVNDYDDIQYVLSHYALIWHPIKIQNKNFGN